MLALLNTYIPAIPKSYYLQKQCYRLIVSFQNLYVQVLTPVLQNVALFGNRVIAAGFSQQEVTLG